MVGLFGVTAAGLLAVPILTPDFLAREARYRACADTVSADCLADLAVEAGLSGKAPSQLFGVGAFLADDDAHALILRAFEQAGKASEDAYREADARLAPLRVARAVRQGMTPAQAYAAVPQVRYGSAYIAALHLLGKNPDGGSGGASIPTNADRLAGAEFAYLLIGLAVDLRGRQREGALDYAAELLALTGDHDRATQVFLGIEREDDWNGIISPSLISPTIAAAALDRCNGRAECRGRVLFRAAMVAETLVEAEAMLGEAFAIHRSEEPWPDFDEMAKIVKLAVELETRALALDLARALDKLAQSREGVFPVFPHIRAAQGLLSAGAPDQEVRAALERAQAEMSISLGSTIGLGHMGPITWGGGIGEQARWEQAALWARLGDAGRAVRLMDGIADPAHAWGEVFGPDTPPASLDKLLPAAAEALNGTELLRLRAQIAAGMFWFDGSPAQLDWALRTAREVIPEVDPDADQALETCLAIARVSEGEDDALRMSALACAGEAALKSRDSAHLLRAAEVWFNYESARSAQQP